MTDAEFMSGKGWHRTELSGEVLLDGHTWHCSLYAYLDAEENLLEAGVPLERAQIEAPAAAIQNLNDGMSTCRCDEYDN